MDWQQCASLLIVATAALLLLRGVISRRKFSFERDTHCGCSTRSDSSLKPSIIYRARKGQRPEILMKWS